MLILTVRLCTLFCRMYCTTIYSLSGIKPYSASVDLNNKNNHTNLAPKISIDQLVLSNSFNQ